MKLRESLILVVVWLYCGPPVSLERGSFALLTLTFAKRDHDARFLNSLERDTELTACTYLDS